MRFHLNLALFISLFAVAAWAGAKAATHVYVNGSPLRDEALIHNGVTYVLLRAVAEALNCTVSYDPKSGVFIWSNPQAPSAPEVTLPGGVSQPQPSVPQPGAGVPTQSRVEVPAGPRQSR